MLCLSFLCTFLSYTFHRIYRKSKRNLQNNSEREMWLANNIRSVKAVSLGLGIIGIIFLSQLSLIGLMLFAVLSIVVYAYIAPLPFYSKALPLRQIPFLKPFLIASAWTILLNILPMALNFPINELLQKPLLSLIAVTWLFVFAECIAFDIRDIQADQKIELKTFANSWGISSTKILVIACYSIAILLLITTKSFQHISYEAYLALILSILVGIILTLSISKNKKDSFYTFALDGSFYLPFFFVQVLILL